MSKTVTITSKRQLTIPKDLWNQLNLDGVRYLKVYIENDSLRLQKVNFSSQLSKFWDKTSSSVNGELSDTSIKDASKAARLNKHL